LKDYKEQMTSYAQQALFEPIRFEAYKFPLPQYLGAKFNLLSWIAKFVPNNVNIALDAFAGSQSVAFLLKQRELQVYTNDFLAFCHQIGKSLIENKNELLSDTEASSLFELRANAGTLMQDNFIGNFFLAEEAKMLDSFRANVEELSSPYKRAMALTVMNRSLTRKIIMGHFAHTQARVYASNPERIRRNPSIAQPIKEIFFKLLPKYTEAVFDNGQENKSFNENVLDLLPKLEKIDLVYFDPPYTDSHSDYQSFYHLTETFTRYWMDKSFVNSTCRYEPQLWSGFDKKAEVEESFQKLFAQAADIPHWLISYNDRSYPSVERLAEIIKKYKDVTIEAKPYTNSRGGKGSVAGSHEILFVCRNKMKVFVGV
jgi:adenine-specific DNA-methyltransferase